MDQALKGLEKVSGDRTASLIAASEERVLETVRNLKRVLTEERDEDRQKTAQWRSAIVSLLQDLRKNSQDAATARQEEIGRQDQIRDWMQAHDVAAAERDILLTKMLQLQLVQHASNRSRDSSRSGIPSTGFELFNKLGLAWCQKVDRNDTLALKFLAKRLQQYDDEGDRPLVAEAENFIATTERESDGAAGNGDASFWKTDSHPILDALRAVGSRMRAERDHLRELGTEVGFSPLLRSCDKTKKEVTSPHLVFVCVQLSKTSQQQAEHSLKTLLGEHRSLVIELIEAARSGQMVAPAQNVGPGDSGAADSNSLSSTKILSALDSQLDQMKAVVDASLQPRLAALQESLVSHVDETVKGALLEHLLNGDEGKAENDVNIRVEALMEDMASMRAELGHMTGQVSTLTDTMSEVKVRLVLRAVNCNALRELPSGVNADGCACCARTWLRLYQMYSVERTSSQAGLPQLILSEKYRFTKFRSALFP